MIRAVVDTNPFISAAITPRGTPSSVLSAAGESYRLVWSAGIVAECLRVLTYARVARKLRASGDEEKAYALLARLSAGADVVSDELLPPIQVVQGDPSDNMLIATALAGRASVLVTGDRKHLLSLGTIAGIRIIDAATFARELGLPGFPTSSGSVHEPVAPYGDGMAALALETQRWKRARTRRAKRIASLPL